MSDRAEVPVPRLLAWCLAFSLVACARPASPAPIPSGGPATEARAPTPPPADKPASADTIAGLLKARHGEDLPSRSALDAHDGAYPATLWLAWNADTLAVRTRAARLLGSWPEQKPASELMKLADAGQPAALRAGALDGLAGLPVADREAATATIRAGLADPDPRVALAAVGAASQVPALAGDLKKTSSEHPDERVRAAAGG